MPFVNVPASWTAIVTTTDNTVFQNRENRSIYITTETVSDVREGFELRGGESIIFKTGSAVRAVAPDAGAAGARLYYTVV